MGKAGKCLHYVVGLTLHCVVYKVSATFPRTVFEQFAYHQQQFLRRNKTLTGLLVQKCFAPSQAKVHMNMQQAEFVKKTTNCLYFLL